MYGEITFVLYGEKMEEATFVHLTDLAPDQALPFR